MFFPNRANSVKIAALLWFGISCYIRYSWQILTHILHVFYMYWCPVDCPPIHAMYVFIYVTIAELLFSYCLPSLFFPYINKKKKKTLLTTTEIGFTSFMCKPKVSELLVPFGPTFFHNETKKRRTQSYDRENLRFLPATQLNIFIIGRHTTRIHATAMPIHRVFWQQTQFDWSVTMLRDSDANSRWREHTMYAFSFQLDTN